MRLGIQIGLSVVLAAAAAAASAAQAQVIVNPDWAKIPSGERVSRYYPDDAIDRSVSGRVTLLCLVAANGWLRDCEVESESPIGMGFGAAGLAMAGEFRMKPQTVDGKPVDGTAVRIPLVLVAPSPSARHVITEAVWAAAPSFEDMAAAWPGSMGDTPSGSAVLRCRVGAGGTLTACKVAGQTPRGSSFGEAALTLTGKFRLRMTPEEEETYRRSDIALSFQFLNPATAAGQAHKIVRPDWITRIDARKVIDLFPARAAEAGIQKGVGVADCLVAGDGRMTDCRVSREDPAGFGFGPAAVAIVGAMQMDLWTPDGRPTAGARLRTPIRFNLSPESETDDDAP